MRLETLLAVTGGRLLNDPAISRFDGVALRPEKVERGTLYVTQDPTTVEMALAHGAYGILSTPPCEPLDDESAWIVVEDYDKALVGILRAWLAEHPRRFFHLPYNPYHFAKELGRHLPLKWVDGDIAQIAETILRSGPDENFVTWDRTLLQRLGVAVRPLTATPVQGKIIKSSLFELSAVIEGEYHEKIALPPCLFEDLLLALGFLGAFESIPSPKGVHPIPSFDPLFITADGTIVPEGGSDRVIILVNDQTPCTCFETLESVRWSRVNALFPKNFKHPCDIKLAVISYENRDVLIEKLFLLLRKPGFYPIAGICRRDLTEWIALHRNIPVQKGLF